MEAAVVSRRKLAREIVGALYKDFDRKPSEQGMREGPTAKACLAAVLKGIGVRVKAPGSG